MITQFGPIRADSQGDIFWEGVAPQDAKITQVLKR